MTQRTTLFFDLDGTLMVNPFWKVVFPTVCEAIASDAGVPSDEVYDALHAEHDRRIANPSEDRPSMMDWESIIQKVAGDYGTVFDGTAEQLVVDHAAPPHTATIDGAEDILAKLQAEHRRLVVATMGLSKYQFPVLRALGLYNLFEDWLTPDITNALKTDASFYQNYAEDNALRIHIGDRYDHDCFYPHQLGARTVLRLPIDDLASYDPFERPQHLGHVAEHVKGLMFPMQVLPSAIVVHLDELTQVIEQLEYDA